MLRGKSTVTSRLAHLTSQQMHSQEMPSAWFTDYASWIAPGARVLDVACGQGRHSRLFAERGASVTAVDRDAAVLQSLATTPRVITECRDLEREAWPYPAASFDAVLVCNYLWRPAFASMLGTIKPGGMLLYETFMDGNERFGKPSRSDFLLRSNELLALTREWFRVVGYVEGEVLDTAGQPFAVKQKIAAIKR